jgi:hypothetical protein
MNITEKAIVVSGLVFLYIGVAIAFGSCLNRKHKTVEPDYVSDSTGIKLLQNQRVKQIILDDGTMIIVPDGVTYIELQSIDFQDSN